MAPKQSFVFVVYDKNTKGDVMFAEACMKEDDANHVAEKLKDEGKTNVEVAKVDLDVSTSKAKTGGKRKAPAASKKAKEKSESGDEQDEDEEVEKTPAKPKKTTKKAAPKKADEDDDDQDPRKVVPEGQDGALEGYKLLFTGTMSGDRKTMEKAAVLYGGELVNKLEDTDFIILGTKPGPKKVKQIQDENLKTMSEDQFLEMLKTGEEPSEPAGPATKKQKK